MLITGLHSIWNAFEVGYPFVEAILSIYPAVDELLIADWTSTDGTEKVLRRMEEEFPKIRVIKFPPEKGKDYEYLDFVLDKLLEEAEGEFILQVQADEGYHEKDILKFREVAKTDNKHNVFVQRGLTVCSFRTVHSVGLPRIIRFFRNTGEVYFSEGGAGLRGKTFPIKRLFFPMFHFYNSFPGEQWRRAKRHHLWLATECKLRAERYEYLKKKRAWENDETYRSQGEPLDFQPSLFKGLAMMGEYRVRDVLFDKQWLRETTGLSYS